MDPLVNVWVAAIGAVSSVGAAILAFYAASRATRLKSQADLTLERLKLHDANRRRALELAIQESEPIEKALSQLWNDIQTVREAIQNTVSTADCDEAEILLTLHAAVSRITEGYARHGSSLSPDAAAAWHSAKSHLLGLEEFVRRRGTDARPKEGASSGIDERLLSIRAALRDIQSIIQQSMLTSRGATMKRILELM
jgi:hypothetical protein